MRDKDGARARCADLIGAMCALDVRTARDAILTSLGREVEERCSNLAVALDTSLSYAGGVGVFEPLHMLEPESFVLAESTRGAAIVAAELTRTAASSPRYTQLRATLLTASDELAGLAQKGTTSAEFDRARTKRESTERELVALARTLSDGGRSGLDFDVDSLAARLEEREAAVGFRRFKKWSVRVVDELDSTGQPSVRQVSTDSLCAFVVRSTKGGPTLESGATLTLVELGPIAPIETAVHAWRAGLGVASDSRGLAARARDETTADVRVQGTLLRERIFDPLLAAVGGAQRIVFALDDVLHLVPLDALPLDESTRVGDRWQIETRTTLSEILQIPAAVNETGQLVAFGDVEYGAEGGSRTGAEAAETSDVESQAGDAEPRAARRAGVLRGGAWERGFSALPGTGVEVRGIVHCYADRFGGSAASEVCEHASATRERFLALARNARYLHIATHGWFAPESIRSWSDAEPLDKQSGIGSRTSGAEQVKGMSPMLLCGLAFAGANLPENAVGRVPGLVTADELSTLELSNCELVVLSACDTNVGERRAGQGVASLQKALQMAGARSVITSLWKVPDEATKDLMLDFYRRLWMEKKSKSRALWEAKRKLRDARGPDGELEYSTRDWAAWVLTGDPQ